MFVSFSNVVSVESRSSYKSRTIETGNSFLEGLEMPQNTYVDNSKAIYYKNEFGCDRYEQEVSVHKSFNAQCHIDFMIFLKPSPL